MGQPHGYGTVEIDAARLSPFGRWVTMYGPVVVVDGAEPVVADWSVIPVRVPAGHHRIEVYVSPVSGRYAYAQTWVDVAPGQNVALEYKLPYHRMAGGSLGPPPQRRKGLVVAALGSLTGFVFLLCCAGAIVYGVTRAH